MKKIHTQNLFIVLAIFANILRTNAITVFPIAVSSITNLRAGASAAFCGSNYLVGLQDEVISNGTITDDIVAQLVSTNGSLIGSQIAVGRTGGHPYVCFNGTNYLMIWSDNALSPVDVIYGQFISPSGGLVGGPLDISNPNTNADFTGNESMASDGGNCAVIWTDNGNGDDNFDAYYAIVDPNGSLAAPETLLSTNANCPAIAFGKTNYLAIWQSQNDTGYYDTYGALISTNGTAGQPFIISQTAGPSYNPLCAAFDGTNFLVVWNKDIGPGYPSPAIWNFNGRVVAPNGTFPGNEMVMVTNQEVYPFLSFDGANYLLAAHGGGQTNPQVYFQFFNPSAAAIGPEFTVFSPLGTNAPLVGGAFYGNGQFMATALIGQLVSGGFTANAGTYGAFLPASTAPPRLNAASPIAGRQFTLTLTGTPGINYAIEMNTNLEEANWASVATNFPTTNGAFSFTDTSATNWSRFYRAVMQ